MAGGARPGVCPRAPERWPGECALGSPGASSGSCRRGASRGRLLRSGGAPCCWPELRAGWPPWSACGHGSLGPEGVACLGHPEPARCGRCWVEPPQAALGLPMAQPGAGAGARAQSRAHRVQVLAKTPHPHRLPGASQLPKTHHPRAARAARRCCPRPTRASTFCRCTATRSSRRRTTTGPATAPTCRRGALPHPRCVLLCVYI